MTLYPSQQNFSKGEFTPRLHDRYDLEQYSGGAKKILNWLTLRQGGVRRRPGFKFVFEVANSAKKSRGVPFAFNVEDDETVGQAYFLEFFENAFRVFADGGVVTEADVNITGATQANPVVITTAGHSIADGSEVIISGVAGMTELNGRRFTTANATGTTFELSGVDGSAYTAYTSGGAISEIVEVTTVYSESQVQDIHYTQSNDVLYVAHREHPPYKITRTSNTSWTVEQIDFQDGPYLNENETATTLTASASTGSVTITASATTGINDDAGFNADDVGRLVRIRDGSSYYHWYKITAFTDTTHVTATYQSGWNDVDDLELTTGPTGATEHWRLGAWSENTGWPARVSFFEERLAWARTDTQTQTLWFSRAGDFENHRPGIKDDDAITATILAGQSNSISWMAEGDLLQIGTTGATRTIGQSSGDSPFAPTNLKQKRATTYRSKAVLPIQVGSVTLFAGAFGKNIREFVYSLDADSFIAPDISILSEHLFRSPIVEMAYQQDPDSIGWIVTEDGKMAAMTYERDQKMVSFTSQETAGEVESVVSIPGSDRDEVWIVVKREIDGNTKRYIETLAPHFQDDGSNDATSAIYVDSAISYSGTAANSFSGADHLNGETVQVFGDGAVHPDVVVADGIISLPDGVTAETIHAGLGYTSTLRTLPLLTTGRDGTLLGRRKRAYKTIVGVLETVLLKIKAGRDAVNVLYRNADDPMDAGQPPRTKIVPVGIDDTWEHDGSLELFVDTPTPATITMVGAGLETEP